MTHQEKVLLWMQARAKALVDVGCNTQITWKGYARSYANIAYIDATFGCTRCGAMFVYQDHGRTWTNRALWMKRRRGRNHLRKKCLILEREIVKTAVFNTTGVLCCKAPHIPHETLLQDPRFEPLVQLYLLGGIA